MCCIDMTPAVVAEAKAKGVDLILAYHPPLFREVKRLVGHSRGMGGVMFSAVSAGMAVYSMHTALDAADGGTNDVLAELVGLGPTVPFSFADKPADECKVVTFVPTEHVDRVADAMSAEGAGQIGLYQRCSYRIAGQGVFFGGEGASPTVGQRGRLETVDEIRLEMVASSRDLPAVCSALVSAHPYEEPAYDVYTLRAKPGSDGIGRVGNLQKKTTLAALARRLKKEVGAKGVQIVGRPNGRVGRAAILVGAAGTLPLTAPNAADADLIITGEIRHHDALTILRHGKSAIALGHWTSERLVLNPLAKKIRRALPGLKVHVSRADAEPLCTI
jgi:dinuclear metal center YbgI/SA1388 family protein